MKKLYCTLLLIILAVLPSQAKNPLFYGGSVNFTGGANLFVGYQINNKIGVIANYYGNDIVSADLLLNGFVVSEGFNPLNKSQNFLTLLYTPKIMEFSKTGKIFGKVGLNFAGQLSKINHKNISIVIGVGFRWN